VGKLATNNEDWPVSQDPGNDNFPAGLSSDGAKLVANAQKTAGDHGEDPAVMKSCFWKLRSDE
jgi:hypothetical protein